MAGQGIGQGRRCSCGVPPPDADVGTLDITDSVAFSQALYDFEPEILVNLAPISAVAQCWREPELALPVNGKAVYSLLERTREFELASAIFEWIEGWYNPRRRHSTLGMLSPHDYETLHTGTENAA